MAKFVRSIFWSNDVLIEDVREVGSPDTAHLLFKDPPKLPDTGRILLGVVSDEWNPDSYKEIPVEQGVPDRCRKSRPCVRIEGVGLVDATEYARKILS